jgi:hypothetical protein
MRMAAKRGQSMQHPLYLETLSSAINWIADIIRSAPRVMLEKVFEDKLEEALKVPKVRRRISGAF